MTEGNTGTVNFATADGTATASSGDYVAIPTPSNPLPTLTFAPGTTSQSITVIVNGDNIGEPNEIFSVNLSNAINATIADEQGIGTILVVVTSMAAMGYWINYQLVGKDSDWQGPTNSETIEYFDLKPRNYSFKVQAVDRDLNYSEVVSLQLILPPLWHQAR